jgi:hypothetical protein
MVKIELPSRLYSKDASQKQPVKNPPQNNKVQHLYIEYTSAQQHRRTTIKRSYKKLCAYFNISK